MVTQGLRARIRDLVQDRPLQVMTIAALVAGTAAVAGPIGAADSAPRQSLLTTAVEEAAAAVATPEPPVMELVWEGKDVDEDGKADFANPTGHEPRGHDAYGHGQFGASRDGGVRRHEGVDFVAKAGQTVVAPISGYVTKIGLAYAGDSKFKYVEITNPALHYQARVFYLKPKVQVGDTVAVGQPIGAARSLQGKYPGGMTDHVHVEVMDRRGQRFDVTEVITAEYAVAD